MFLMLFTSWALGLLWRLETRIYIPPNYAVMVNKIYTKQRFKIQDKKSNGQISVGEFRLNLHSLVYSPSYKIFDNYSHNTCKNILLKGGGICTSLKISAPVVGLWSISE